MIYSKSLSTSNHMPRTRCPALPSPYSVFINRPSAVFRGAFNNFKTFFPVVVPSNSPSRSVCACVAISVRNAFSLCDKSARSSKHDACNTVHISIATLCIRSSAAPAHSSVGAPTSGVLSLSFFSSSCASCKAVSSASFLKKANSV